MAQIIVDTLQDVTDPDDTLTSLREAVALAAGTPERDEITFAAELSGTLVLEQGRITIGSSLSLDGDTNGDGDIDIVIDANGFESLQGALVIDAEDVSLSNLEIRNGREEFDPLGGNLTVQEDASAELTNLRLLDGVSSYFAYDYDAGTVSGRYGGALANKGTVVLRDSYIADHSRIAITSRGSLT
ncbi:MAG: hypothetical protein AAF908_11880, partial [Pseudomonadota bacterium]